LFTIKFLHHLLSQLSISDELFAITTVVSYFIPQQNRVSTVPTPPPGPPGFEMGKNTICSTGKAEETWFYPQSRQERLEHITARYANLSIQADHSRQDHGTNGHQHNPPRNHKKRTADGRPKYSQTSPTKMEEVNCLAQNHCISAPPSSDAKVRRDADNLRRRIAMLEDEGFRSRSDRGSGKQRALLPREDRLADILVKSRVQREAHYDRNTSPPRRGACGTDDDDDILDWNGLREDVIR